VGSAPEASPTFFRFVYVRFFRGPFGNTASIARTVARARDFVVGTGGGGGGSGGSGVSDFFSFFFDLSFFSFFFTTDGGRYRGSDAPEGSGSERPWDKMCRISGYDTNRLILLETPEVDRPKRLK
jgi:hypothetical protein